VRAFALAGVMASVAGAAGAHAASPASGDTTPGDTSGGSDLPAVGTPERCELNRAAGHLIFMTGFDYAADAGILDIVVAEQEGFFDDMCLDVELQPGVAPANTSALAAGQTQLGVVASFSELVNTNVNGGADLMAIAQLGHTSITTLLVPADSPIQELADFEGVTIGIKGDLPPDIAAMLATAGVNPGDYTELLLDGFDPIAHFELGIDALPVYKSNEPDTLTQAGFEFRAFDPLDYDIPSSFALYMITRSFYEEHPTVVEDFVRAGLMGYYFAAEDPEAAVDDAFELIDAGENQFFLAREHELFRWNTELEIIQTVTPEGYVIGQVDVDSLGAEIQTRVDLGLFDETPAWEDMVDASLVPRLYDDAGELIWEPMGS
jgi:NitT/TauT family transport system substrate-binding protein